MKENKLKAFFERNKTAMQFLKYTAISLVVAAIDLVVFYLIKLALNSLNDKPFHWFIFNYEGKGQGLGTMIAFLASTTLGQIISFIENRKKTFNANNNIMFSVTVYVIMMLTIIGLQTYTGPMLVDAINGVVKNDGAASFLGKFAWMGLAFVFVFPVNKFIIMRRLPKPTDEKDQPTTPKEEKPVEETEKEDSLDNK